MYNNPLLGGMGIIMEDKKEQLQEITENPQIEEKTYSPPPQIDSDMVNKIVTEREKRTINKLEKKLEEMFARQASLMTPSTASTEDHEVEDAKKVSKRIKEMETKMAKQVEEIRAEAQREKQAARKAEEKVAMQAALQSAGVANLKGAMAVLESDGKFGRDENGQIRFFVPKDGYVDELSLEEGLKAWLASDDGKHYLPPTGTVGSGNAPTRRNPRGNLNPAEKRQEAYQAIHDWIMSGGKRQ